MENKQDNDLQSITLDGTKYSFDTLSDEAQRLARQATMTADYISQLETKAAIARTAQSRYIDSLKTVIQNDQKK